MQTEAMSGWNERENREVIEVDQDKHEVDHQDVIIYGL